jgi:hypothetical protein
LISKRQTKIRFAHLLFLSLIFFSSVFGENYSGTRRPALDSLTPLPIQERSFPSWQHVTANPIIREDAWERLLTAELEAIAQIFELYPTQEIYFMERDAGRLYEAAKFAAKVTGDESLSRRLHSLYVSRNSQDSPLLKDYLAQEGITAERVKAQPIVLVDTGFTGTLVNRIRGMTRLPLAETKKMVLGHFLKNTNERFPSSTVFMRAMGSRSDRAMIDGMNWSQTGQTGIIHWYARVPKYDGALIGYQRRDGKIIPQFKTTHDENDGNIDPRKAEELSKQTLFFYQNHPGTMAYLEKRRALWKDLRNIYQREDSEAFNRELTKLKSEKNALSEGIIIDAINNFRRIFPEKQVKVQADLAELAAHPRDNLPGDNGGLIYGGDDPSFTMPIGYCIRLFERVQEVWPMRP